MKCKLSLAINLIIPPLPFKLITIEHRQLALPIFHTLLKIPLILAISELHDRLALQPILIPTPLNLLATLIIHRPPTLPPPIHKLPDIPPPTHKRISPVSRLLVLYPATLVALPVAIRQGAVAIPRIILPLADINGAVGVVVGSDAAPDVHCEFALVALAVLEEVHSLAVGDVVFEVAAVGAAV